MKSQPDLSIVIPAFNEEARLGPTLEAYTAYCRGTARRVEVIVVDDGSLDRTSVVVNSFASSHPEVRLIRLAENQGKGHAVRSGVVNARGKQILFADADAATPLSELERLEAALDGGADVAIGSRCGTTA
jgi:dolichyl-phosphate beta-glucosyltransferase